MTENKRIFLNIIATYGRSVVSIVCGLFTGRWLLMALGEVDYGLFGVVGGLAGFIAMINSILGGSVGRYYAICIGKERAGGRGAVESVQWFNTALFVHTVIPVLLMCIGYPVGIWAIKSFLNIPADRVMDCVWVFRFTCIATFVSMFSVAFTAMYQAKQYIAELTIYSFIQTLVNFVFMYYMVTHPGDWLVRYGLYVCLLQAVPLLIICVRAYVVFGECKLVPREMINLNRFRQLGMFATWQFFGGIATIARGQGMAILINKYFGARINAAMSVASTVNQQSATLSTAMQGAFSPVIVSSYGAGDIKKTRAFCLKGCKFGALLVLLFTIPLSLEIREVMDLWLKNTPPYAPGLCLCMMITLVFDKLTSGYIDAVNAVGKIAVYQIVVGGVQILSLPIAWIMLALGVGPYSVGIAFILTQIMTVIGRVMFGKKLVGVSVSDWVLSVLLPVALCTLVTVAISTLPMLFIPASFIRVVITSSVSLIVFATMVSIVCLDDVERKYVKGKLMGLWKRFH